MDAVPVLLRHLARAEADRRAHLARQHKGNVEALVAGLKVRWLVDLVREIDGPEAAARAEAIRKRQ